MKFFKNISGLEKIRESFSTRHVKYGGYAALISLGVLIALLMLNLLIGQFPIQLDLTRNQIFSLSDQTLEILDQLDSPIKFYGLWTPGTENPVVMDTISQYLSRSRHITLDILDPDRNPGFTMRYDRERRGISQGSIIVEGDMGFRLITPFEMFDFFNMGDLSVTDVMVERRISNAILFVGTGTTPVIYELTGHGQTSLSFFGIYEYLDRENYDMRQINLMLSDIPDDATVIVIYGPQRDLAPMEADKLLEYLDNGGRLMVFADYNIRELTNLNRVLASFGIAYNYGIVHERDPSYFTMMDSSVVLPDVIEHDITNALLNKERTPIMFITAMSISELPTRRRQTEVIPLLHSSSGAFLRSDLNITAADVIGGDTLGPHIYAVAVEDPGTGWINPMDPEPQTRIVAFGDANILMTALRLGIPANMDLFMNSLTWLHDRQETGSVRSRSHIVGPMHLTMTNVITYGVLFIGVIPIAFFVSGFVVWLKRRHL